jgi:osmotically-inducible protein OsmY
MSSERTRAIHQVAAGRSLDAAGRVRRALRELQKRGGEVTFAAVAAAANVSRQYLYTHSELRAEIEQLRGEQRAALSRRPVAERASDESIRTRLRAALEDNQRLRQENTRLREELALAHGSVRELELARRTGRST